MRALCVGRAAEASEAWLLCTLVGLRWPRGFGVEGAVQALVRPVRLRSPRFNATMADAERDPPHGERAQAAEGGGRDRRAVGRAHGVGPAELLEQALDEGAGLSWLRREPRRAASENAAVGVGHRQGGAGEAIAGAALALADRRPDGRRCRGLEGEGSRVPVPTAALARLA
jgi:hypothetical protein